MRQKIINIFLVLFIFLTNVTLAQKRITTQAPITVSLTRGTNINQLNGDLNFISPQKSNIKSSLIKNPSDGMLLEITGISNRNVIMNYEATELRSTGSSKFANNSPMSISFEPDIILINQINYTESKSNGVINFKNKTTNDKFTLSIGGKLTVPHQESHGEYNGNFILTLTY